MREAVVLIVPDVGARAGEGEASASRLVVLAVHEEALELLVDDEHGLAAHCPHCEVVQRLASLLGFRWLL